MQDHNHYTGLSWSSSWGILLLCFFLCFFSPCSLAQESCCCVALLRAIWCACWAARAAHLNKPVTLFTFVTVLDLHLGGMVCWDSFVTSFENVCFAVNFWILQCIVSQRKDFLQCLCGYKEVSLAFESSSRSTVSLDLQGDSIQACQSLSQAHYILYILPLLERRHFYAVEAWRYGFLLIFFFS